MADVWVATNLADNRDTVYALIHADDVRHQRLVGDRPRLLARGPAARWRSSTAPSRQSAWPG